MKCPYCNEELKETSIYMDGNNCFSHKYIGALEGGKDRCPLDGETLHYRAWQELTKTKQDQTNNSNRTKGLKDMSGQSLNYYTYKILTEQNLIEWVQNCLSGVSDEVIIPEHIAENIKSLSNSLAEFICYEKYKDKTKTSQEQTKQKD